MTSTPLHARRAPRRTRIADLLFMIAICVAIVVGVKVGMDYAINSNVNFPMGH